MIPARQIEMSNFRLIARVFYINKDHGNSKSDKPMARAETTAAAAATITIT